MTQSLFRIEVSVHPSQGDPVGRRVAREVGEALSLPVDRARMVKVFTLSGVSREEADDLVRQAALHDPVLQQASLAPVESDADWIIEVGFRPGVTDNEGRTARDTAALVLGRDRHSLAVYTSAQYHFWGGLARKDAEAIARGMLCNELIQRFRLKSGEEWRAQPGFDAQAAAVSGSASDEVLTVPVSQMDDAALLEYSRSHTLALTLEEMKTIQDWFARQDVRERRREYGLGPDPTDAEVEVLAQTWSEHCKHKIFASRVTYENKAAGTVEEIDNLYKTYIQKPTRRIRGKRGEKDYCRSVFSDNAGVIAFNDDYDVCIKVETHNSPSALDPYGGALTGIVGVNRDPMGTGMGAELVCNTDVFCFASPYHKGELPPRLLHPRRVMEGVRRGVEDGGNKSGIPTVNGSVVFDERYLGKPLVYCGTVGMLPRELHGRPGHYKKAHAGDAIVMAGGRIGKDGIHGATFSSEELHEGSPATAVQIGDPITQRKMYDFLMRARDLGLYNAITDNGAGGLSSSVGEMAEDTGGCRIDLALAPVKYDGLRPWEIFISEAQERMTLAVPPEKLEEFLALARRMDVEATRLGEFTDTGRLVVTYGDKPVCALDMEFMHHGLPQLRLNAVWEGEKDEVETRLSVPAGGQADFLMRMMARLNICSKEYMIRQYDHEVRGGSVVKPLVGLKQDGPADAAVFRPRLESERGVVLSHGICPRYSDYDAYWMLANAIDEGVRNAVAAGGDPDYMAGVDNFCWCDPVESPKTPDGRVKMGKLVRACQALETFCEAYGCPCISGKDSMKNDYSWGDLKISIPPTVLFSVIGVMDDVNKAMTSDFKHAGDRIYLLGGTFREMAGSEAAAELGVEGARVPHVDAQKALARYRAVHKAIGAGLVSACHDCSDGGLAVAVAEMCIGGRLGAGIDLASVSPSEDLNDTEALYSESASRLLVSVPEDKAAEFEALTGGDAALIGAVEEGGELRFRRGEEALFACSVEDLAASFKSTLDW
jgi:phosphoribosylformylglycinamidine synthase